MIWFTYMLPKEIFGFNLKYKISYKKYRLHGSPHKNCACIVLYNLYNHYYGSESRCVTVPETYEISQVCGYRLPRSHLKFCWRNVKELPGHLVGGDNFINKIKKYYMRSQQGLWIAEPLDIFDLIYHLRPQTDGEQEHNCLPDKLDFIII